MNSEDLKNKLITRIVDRNGEVIYDFTDTIDAIKNKINTLEKENQELKETLNKTRKMGLEIIKEKEQLSNELYKLNCYRNIELNEITKLKKAIEILKVKKIDKFELKFSYSVNEYNIMARNSDFDELTKEEYELLKEVFGDEN